MAERTLKLDKKLFKVFLFFSIWFVLGIGLHIQIFPLNMTVSDRWFYFPMVGIAGITAIVIQNINFSYKKLKVFGYIIAVIFIVLLSLRTIIRNADWQNALKLYTHDVKTHANYDIENNLGGAYVGVHRYDEALEHYKKSVEMFPYEANLYNLGSVYEQMGDLKKAKKYYYKAINARNYFSEDHKHPLVLYERLAGVLVISDSPKTAKEFIEAAIGDYPKAGSLWALLAISEYKLKNKQSALAAAEKATMLLPNASINYIYTQILNDQPITLNH